MLIWLKHNIGTLVVGLILLAAVLYIIFRLIQRKKAGKCIGCDACSKNCKSSGCGTKSDKNKPNTN